MVNIPLQEAWNGVPRILINGILWSMTRSAWVTLIREHKVGDSAWNIWKHITLLDRCKQRFWDPACRGCKVYRLDSLVSLTSEGKVPRLGFDSIAKLRRSLWHGKRAYAVGPEICKDYKTKEQRCTKTQRPKTVKKTFWIIMVSSIVFGSNPIHMLLANKQSNVKLCSQAQSPISGQVFVWPLETRSLAQSPDHKFGEMRTYRHLQKHIHISIQHDKTQDRPRLGISSHASWENSAYIGQARRGLSWPQLQICTSIHAVVLCGITTSQSFHQTTSPDSLWDTLHIAAPLHADLSVVLVGTTMAGHIVQLAIQHRRLQQWNFSCFWGVQIGWPMPFELAKPLWTGTVWSCWIFGRHQTFEILGPGFVAPRLTEADRVPSQNAEEWPSIGDCALIRLLLRFDWFPLSSANEKPRPIQTVLCQLSPDGTIGLHLSSYPICSRERGMRKRTFKRHWHWDNPAFEEPITQRLAEIDESDDLDLQDSIISVNLFPLLKQVAVSSFSKARVKRLKTWLIWPWPFSVTQPHGLPLTGNSSENLWDSDVQAP